MLTRSSSSFQLFWSSYDPLDMASDSIDVLGLQSVYVMLADHFLPGLTTITTSPRYVSMLCAAVGTAEKMVPIAGLRVGELRSERLRLVKSYERAWALASVLASSTSSIGEAAVDGLRGVRSVRRRPSELSQRDRNIRTGSFNLLANQVRYGGVGAYSVMLDTCCLASITNVSLRPLGAALGEAFPGLPDTLEVWDEDRPLAIEAIREWGNRCCLNRFSSAEATQLRKALQGGPEGSWDDDVRWVSLRLIAKAQQQEGNERMLLSALIEVLQASNSPLIKAPEGCLRQVHATLLLIPHYEEFCQSLHFIFDTMRAAASDKPEVLLSEILSKTEMADACRAVCRAGSELLLATERSREIHSDSTNRVATLLQPSAT